MTKRFLQTLLIICLFQSQVIANHILGGEITYKNLGGLKYEITIKFYRDCRGIPSGAPGAIMRSGSTTKNLSLTLISIKDVSNYCKKTTNPCNPPNTSAGKGTEEHIYTDTVDFNKADSAFKKLCKVQFGMGGCCRNGEITTGPSGNNFWVFSNLDFCEAPKNTSPVFTSIPNNILCCNQPYFYNVGAVDSLDRDSLSYQWEDPMQDWTTKVNWSGGRSKSSPFSDYWPKGYDKNKGPNPNTNPPIGTYLDPETGDIILTPMDCSESTVASIKVTEWRKDSTGKYKVIGEVRRDLQYFVVVCSDNNPPLLYGPYKYEVCAGNKLCFNISSDDKQFIPPPPAKPLPPDTVALTWNKGIGKGATFKIVDTTARLQRAQFCWTPKESDASDIPYTFTVTARDNACPRNGMTIKSYSVKVKKIAKATLTKSFIKNGLYELKSEIDKGFKGNATYSWEVLDSAMNPLDTSAYYFLQYGNLKSNRQLDSVQFYKGGRYIIHHRINNPPLNCPADYFDSLQVASVSPILKVSPSGLLQNWVCKNTTDTIFPILKNAKNPVKFRWSSSKADTLPYLVVRIDKDTIFRVDVYDGAGYHRFAEWKYTIYAEPVLAKGKDILACFGDTVSLGGVVINYTDTVYWKWFFEGKQISSAERINVFKPGVYHLEISDSTQCTTKRDTLEVNNMVVNVSAGMDRKVCKGDTVMLKATGADTSNGKKGKYNWYVNTLSSSAIDTGSLVTYRFKTDTTMIVKLIQTKDALSCSDLDTLKVAFRPLPLVELGRATICQNETELDLHTIILKPTSSYKGIVSWRLLKTLQKPGGADNTLNDLVYDKDNSSSDHYYLKVDKSIIDLKIRFTDSVMLGLIYKDEFGCQNVSSNDASIVIRSNVDVTFNYDEQKRCYGDSVTYISNDYGVNYYGGKWFTNNDSSNYLKWPQGNIVQLSEKLGTQSLDPKGGKYLMKYVLENNKCLSYKNAILTLIPYPAIVWTQSDKGSDSIAITDKTTNASRREWYVNSKKVSEGSVIIVSKQDAKQQTIMLKVFNSNCETDSVIVPKVVDKIGKLNSARLYISPNPVKDELLINTSVNQVYKVEIINSLGQMVLTQSFSQSLGIINVSNLPDGIYSLILKTGNEIFIEKFLKKSD